MANYPRVRDQHVAVFGESGSGKTVLVSSFFGPTQEGSYKNELWDLVADDTGQGVRLYQNYLGMRDNSTAPMATRFANTTYYFSLKLKGPSSMPRRSVPSTFSVSRGTTTRETGSRTSLPATRNVCDARTRSGRS